MQPHVFNSDVVYHEYGHAINDFISPISMVQQWGQNDTSILGNVIGGYR